MNKYLTSAVGAALLLTPFVAFAETLEDTLRTVNNLIGVITPIVVALALIYFFWGLASLLLGKADDKGREEARNKMIYGILILFVMLSVWGLVGVLQDTFNVGGNQQITPPSVNTGNTGTRR